MITKSCGTGTADPAMSANTQHTSARLRIARVRVAVPGKTRGIQGGGGRSQLRADKEAKVTPMTELVLMISGMRQYEAAQRMMQSIGTALRERIQLEGK